MAEETRHDVAPRLGEPAPTSLRVHIAVMALFVLPCIAVSQFAAHLQAAILDDHLFAYFGWRIRNGAALYVDVWDHKPPGIFWLDAIGFLIGGESYGGIILLCTLALVATHVLFFIAGSLVYHRGSAALATILAALYLTHGLFFAGGNRAETFLIPCELALMTFYLLGLKRDRNGYWFAAGLCGGVAVLFKQSGLAALVAACLHTVILAVFADLSLRRTWQRCGLLLAGAATILLLATLYLAARGSLGETWFAIVTFNRLKVAYQPHEWFDLAWWTRWSDRFSLSILRLPMLMALAAMVHATLRRVRRLDRSANERGNSRWPTPICANAMLLFGLWFAIAAIGAVVSPGSSAHRFLPALPPLLLLGAYLIDALKTEARLLDRLARRAWVVAVCLLMAYLASDAIYLNYQRAAQVYWDRKPRIENGHWAVDPTVWQQVGDEVAAMTTSDDAIQCWNYTPQVYLQACRPNASRFIAEMLCAMVPPGSTHIDREYLETLRARPPKVIVIRSDRYEALCVKKPSADDEAGRWLNANYLRRDELTRGNLNVLMRKQGRKKPRFTAARRPPVRRVRPTTPRPDAGAG
jgi:hypothetical protein